MICAFHTLTTSRSLDVSDNYLTGYVPHLVTTLGCVPDVTTNCLELYCNSRQPTCPCTDGATAAEEIGALLDLYRFTDGSQWRNGSDWPIQADPVRVTVTS